MGRVSVGGWYVCVRWLCGVVVRVVVCVAVVGWLCGDGGVRWWFRGGMVWWLGVGWCGRIEKCNNDSFYYIVQCI